MPNWAVAEVSGETANGIFGNQHRRKKATLHA